MAKAKAPRYPLKDIYCSILEQETHEVCWAEYYFHPERKWRMDYAFPRVKVAIEIDGGIYVGGRHSRGMGQEKDFEKLNAAAELGWRVLHYTPRQKMTGSVLDQIKRTVAFTGEDDL